jgi:hypothetical protein
MVVESPSCPGGSEDTDTRAGACFGSVRPCDCINTPKAVMLVPPVRPIRSDRIFSSLLLLVLAEFYCGHLYEAVLSAGIP